MKHIYEINTAVWLTRLSVEHGKMITLATIPEEEIERMVNFGIDTVWLMGIWQRSPLAAEINAADERLVRAIRQILPDFAPGDIIGSAYAIKHYAIDERFGNKHDLRKFRERLASHSIKLLLDFVPNHTAFDHPWIHEHPERYITSPSGEPVGTHQFRRCDNRYIANGQDPSFAPWPDVAQLNAFSPSYRSGAIETLYDIASLCDGVRCDMAMLLINDIFAKSWGELAGPTPHTEYWSEIITATKTLFPEFIFIAECYWKTEQRLVELGFDFVYDKTTYDYLAQHKPYEIRHHLAALRPIEKHLLHFLENHDEPRAATIFSDEDNINAATFIKDLPGACLWHDGQFDGFRFQLPVHIGRGPTEPINKTLLDQYRSLLGATTKDAKAP